MKRAAIGGILLAGILWGVIGVFIRTLEDDGLAALQVVFMRVFFGAAILLVIQAIRSPKSLRIRLKDIWCFVGSGITGFAFFNFCYFTTMEYASLSLAAILLYTAPSIVIILSAVLFKERICAKKMIALVLAFAGCMCAAGIFRGETALSAPALLSWVRLWSGLCARYSVHTLRAQPWLLLDGNSYLYIAICKPWHVARGQMCVRCLRMYSPMRVMRVSVCCSWR